MDRVTCWPMRVFSRGTRVPPSKYIRTFARTVLAPWLHLRSQEPTAQDLVCQHPWDPDERPIDVSTTVFLDDVAHKLIASTAQGLAAGVRRASEQFDMQLHTVGGAQNHGKQ
eukprot:3757998-Pyramimonas_sp.AAC.1